MDSTLLQIFLGINIFAMGALAVIAYEHYREHERSQTGGPANHPAAAPAPLPSVQLPSETRERLLKNMLAQYETIMNKSAEKLHQDLGVTITHINNLVLRLASEIVSGELENYRAQLTQLHKQAETGMSGIRTEVSKHQAEIEAKIAAELEAEKQRLISQIDTKLADAVGSFLTETLQHNVDLGSQSAYLVSMLEEHKAELIKEVGDETKDSA